MKSIYATLFLVVLFYSANSQSVAINTTAAAPNTSAILDVSSTTKGLLLPRMSTAQINSIVSPAKGLLVYDSVKNQLMVNMGTAAVPNWQTIVYSSGWNLAGNSGISPATQFIGTTDVSHLFFVSIVSVQASLILF